MDKGGGVVLMATSTGGYGDIIDLYTSTEYCLDSSSYLSKLFKYVIFFSASKAASAF
ncbi:hypothetical protein J6590_072484 [Homalodisca vitripennis]|nr:hypothetical protein J6590_072484 [Homalodisca vitripennis]